MTRTQTNRQRDGIGFGLVSLIGVVIVMTVVVALLLALYGKASDAIDQVTDCAATSGVGVPCTDGATR